MMSSLYIGSTGMISHAANMSVITNNLANVNTVGYKKTSMEFQDLLSQSVTANSNMITNMSQCGMGSRAAAIRTLFTDGSYESGSAVTDLGISGIGFFGVVNEKGTMNYTRAGNFRFTESGELLDPKGWNLVGHQITNGVQSANVTPIKLDLSANGVGLMAGKASTAVTASLQLGKITDNSTDVANPFFAMTSSYDATKQPALSSMNYSYSQPITFYDANGEQQTATMFFDHAGTSDGKNAIEYTIAIDPAKDTSSLSGTAAAGLLMSGTMTFSSTGEMINMTAFTPPSSGNPANLNDWQAASYQNGLPVMNVGMNGLATQSLSMNFGLTLPDASNSGLTDAAAAGSSPSAVFSAATGATLQANATTVRGTSNSSKYLASDGYTAGELRDLNISSEGTVTALYTNGQSQDIYAIPLYRFTSQDGLRSEGGNHYSATLESGNITAGTPGTENFGKLNSWSLETSNVDYATEFTNLIITQRGFQANSKIITTSDAMLQKAMEIKRA